MIDAIREMKQKYAQKQGRGDHLSVIFWSPTSSIFFSNRWCLYLFSIMSYIIAPSFQPVFPFFLPHYFPSCFLFISFAYSSVCHLLLPLNGRIYHGNRFSDFSHLFPKMYSAEFPLGNPHNNSFLCNFYCRMNLLIF